jgi:L-lactate utilization protein LutC
MAGGKLKKGSNRNQGNLASSEPNSPTLANSGYTITSEKQDMNLKSLLMMMMEDFKKEIQENTGKQLEAFKEETQKFLRKLQEKTTKQVMELNKTTQDLKMEVKTIKKTQREITLEIENHRFKHQQQNTRDGRIPRAEDSIGNMDTTMK